MINRILKTIAGAAILFATQFTFAQNPGDTTTVQGFVFSSQVRDTQIVFPNYDANQVERIWMKYTMRCKDGLVSTSSDRNKGCGEWDFSANTYIVDSTRIDSTKSEINNYFIYPKPSSDNKYSLSQTYDIYDTTHYEVNINSINSETSTAVTANGTATSYILAHQTEGGKSFVLLNAAQLGALTTGSIDALSLFSNGSTNSLNHLVIRMKEVAFSSLEGVPYSELTNGTEVYHSDWIVTNGENKIPFYQPFSYTSGTHILVEIVSSSTDGGSSIALAATAVSAKQSLTNKANQYARFFPGNYIHVNGYKGVTGTTSRTIEAWIKTKGTEVDVVSWGESKKGKRFTIKVNTDGKPIVEVHQGSVVGNQIVNDGEWHHIAISLSGLSLTNTKFYVDGAPINSLIIQNTAINTSAYNDVEISRGDWNNYFNGEMDDIRIWSTDVSAENIAKYFNTRVDTNHPNYSDLELNYTFDSSLSTVEDLSPNGNDGEFKGGAVYGNQWTGNHYFDFISSSTIPDITLHQADYDLTINAVIKQDSIGKTPYVAVENYVDAATGFDSDISSNYLSYYPSKNSYHQNGTVTHTESADVFTLSNSTLNYYKRVPSELELLSLVTPYGIGLNLGQEGVAWYFDVTDFYPVLKGSKGLRMTGGGEWQEDIDIQFLFVHGTPTREVLDFRQIWKVGHTPFANILSNKEYEQRTIKLPSATANAKIRSAITGHGQEGEFIPRQHSLNINNGSQVYNWEAWMKCSENPIYPQGGTWIYDRAGWCPGMPTQMEEWDVSAFIIDNEIKVDYGIATASGDSRYIVNHQIVAYGANNFATDARIVTVEAPNNEISYGRINPTCFEPIIIVQNNGSNEITSMEISYKINNGTVATYEWTGSLSFLEEGKITLPVPAGFWNSALDNETNTFSATLTKVNGGTDEYAQNNSYKSNFEVVDIMASEFVLEVKTNATAFQNKYRIEDVNGTVILERDNLANNTIYADTLRLSAGCYKYFIEDSGENGIDFWANQEGKGYMRLKKLSGGLIKRMEGDFGASYTYEFSVTQSASIDNQTMYTPTYNVSPIPANDFINIDIKGDEEGKYMVLNTQGQQMKTGTLANLKEDPTVSILNWDTGVYFIHFNTENQTTVKKFIRN